MASLYIQKFPFLSVGSLIAGVRSRLTVDAAYSAITPGSATAAALGVTDGFRSVDITYNLPNGDTTIGKYVLLTLAGGKTMPARAVIESPGAQGIQGYQSQPENPFYPTYGDYRLAFENKWLAILRQIYLVWGEANQANVETFDNEPVPGRVNTTQGVIKILDGCMDQAVEEQMLVATYFADNQGYEMAQGYTMAATPASLALVIPPTDIAAAVRDLAHKTTVVALNQGGPLYSIESSEILG